MKVQVGTLFPDPGDWCWSPNEDIPDRIVLGTPAGVVRLKVVNGNDPGTPQTWGWNGSLDQPTLTPSIDIDGGDKRWHGHLKNGKLKRC